MRSDGTSGRHRAMEGRCDRCGHIWQEHMPDDGGYCCGECGYEIEHGDPTAPAEPCTVPPPVGVLRYQG